jgi:hypothetical protein
LDFRKSYATFSSTSILPRVALEYGQTCMGGVQQRLGGRRVEVRGVEGQAGADVEAGGVLLEQVDLDVEAVLAQLDALALRATTPKAPRKQAP